MNSIRVQSYYDELKSYYLKTDSDWSDKAKALRSIADHFYHEVSGISGTFNDVLKEFYRWNRQKMVSDLAFSLKNSLNTVVHENRTVSRDTFMTYYSTLVRLIYLSTGVFPDNATQEFIGIKIQDRLSGLNDQQKDAVLCDSRIIYVNAGPGTGKTHLLVNKLVQYIDSSEEPEKIVALSYTNTSAKELGERFFSEAFGCNIQKPYDFYNGTIHSFCFKILKSYSANIGIPFDFIIIDDADIMDLASEIATQLEYRFGQLEIETCLRSRLSSKRPELIQAIEAIKEKFSIISIEDIMHKFLDAFSDSKFRDWLRDQVSILVIDEAQDLGTMNYDIFSQMLDNRPDMKMFLVGDPRQNIFGFNGGSFEHLEAFLLKHADYTQKTLSITYRCPESVNRFVNFFRFSDCENVPLSSNDKHEGAIERRCYNSIAGEARSIIDEIRSHGTMRDSVILCNSLKYLKVLISQLSLSGMPYKVFGGQKVVKEHIKLFNHLLRIIDSDNDYSIRKVSKWTGVTLEHYPGNNQRERFYSTALGKRLQEVKVNISENGRQMEFILQDVADILKDGHLEKGKCDDIDRFVENARSYESIPGLLLAFAIDKDTFAPFYMKDYEECTVSVSDDWITVSTIHSAKGLEWKNVYILGLFEGNLPNGWFVKGKTDAEKKRFYNECQKTMYVAATRAKERLVMTYPKYNMMNQSVIASRFISPVK